MLAAVHLLLALPVFVVVVAVDPAWLRRALADEPGYPLDYLDKIFQIAFALRPMGSSAGRLVDDLLPDTPVPAPRPAPAPPATPAVRPRRAEPVPPPRSTPPRDPGLRPDRLRTREAERAFVKRVLPLLPTPRAVKRLVNTYRLIRASIPVEQTDRFVRLDGTGPYRAVLVLLALVFGTPGSAADLLRAIAAADPGARRLADVVALPDGVVDLVDLCPVADYQRWVGTVARFGFDTTDLVDSDQPDLSA
ncbi:P-loop NTPase fold protein [Actinokineospora soli]|uniref:P-loop NTPase fold protein n=1 Tax=Actinokineospora soli TaxID=1048753 RepID=A0ABW2TUB1_9PSEU